MPQSYHFPRPTSLDSLPLVPSPLILHPSPVVSPSYPVARVAAAVAAVASLAVVLAACGGAPPPQPPAPLSLKHDPQPTTAAISVADLMTRLYVFSDDSMMGREAGTAG